MKDLNVPYSGGKRHSSFQTGCGADTVPSKANADGSKTTSIVSKLVGRFDSVVVSTTSSPLSLRRTSFSTLHVDFSRDIVLGFS